MILSIKIILLIWLLFNFRYEDISYLKFAYNLYNYLPQILVDPFTCPKCLTFWLVLVFTFNIYYAIISAIIQILLYKIK